MIIAGGATLDRASTPAAILPNLRNFGAAAGRPDYPTDLGFMA
jgi:hypothetical protein